MVVKKSAIWDRGNNLDNPNHHPGIFSTNFPSNKSGGGNLKRFNMLNLKEAIPSKQRMEALAQHIFRRISNLHRDKSGEIRGRRCTGGSCTGWTGNQKKHQKYTPGPSKWMVKIVPFCKPLFRGLNSTVWRLRLIHLKIFRGLPLATGRGPGKTNCKGEGSNMNSENWKNPRRKTNSSGKNLGKFWFWCFFKKLFGSNLQKTIKVGIWWNKPVDMSSWRLWLQEKASIPWAEWCNLPLLLCTHRGEGVLGGSSQDLDTYKWITPI